jgi:hypothetical protein
MASLALVATAISRPEPRPIRRPSRELPQPEEAPLLIARSAIETSLPGGSRHQSATPA